MLIAGVLAAGASGSHVGGGLAKRAKPLPGGSVQTVVGVLTKGDEVEIKWIDAPNARERQNFYPAQV